MGPAILLLIVVGISFVEVITGRISNGSGGSIYRSRHPILFWIVASIHLLVALVIVFFFLRSLIQ